MRLKGLPPRRCIWVYNPPTMGVIAERTFVPTPFGSAVSSCSGLKPLNGDSWHRPDRGSAGVASGYPYLATFPFTNWGVIQDWEE